MTAENRSEIWTIGHSTRSIEDFQKLLDLNKIQILADIRTFPGSRRYPHFNKENLDRSLNSAGVEYLHFPELGGRRKPNPDSVNTAWRHAAFKGYADYMATPEFKTSVDRLEDLAKAKRVAYMCSELLWWKCHRSLVSDYLKVRGWLVHHIMDETKIQEHPYTSPARAIQGKLFYN
jgi:uncharacterized protein (DUF488 family)